MRIAHVSDLHLRNSKYRSEYAVALHRLQRQLADLQPDLIVNTGDTVHSKLAVSPELFDDVAKHMQEMTRVAPYWLILGNHDLNLKNKSRMDAISPVVNALQGSTANQLKLLEPGMHRAPGGLNHGFILWNYCIKGHDAAAIDPHPDDINIGLYHGSISGCVTDIGFTMEDGEAEVSKFDAMDYVLLGDIHKRQSFRGGRMQYPGSLIQQNYGEELVKGFLLWDIKSKTEFTCDFHPVEAPGRFHTIQVPASLDLSTHVVPAGSRLRVLVEGDLTPSKRLQLERDVRERYQPLEVIVPDASAERTQEPTDIDRLIADRRAVATEYLEEHGFTDVANEALRLFTEHEQSIEEEASAPAYGTTWSLKRVAWDNVLNYGEGNSIDLTNLKGVVGIFAPNAAGKSSIFDVILQALFDKVTKDVPKNIDVVNDNKDRATMEVEFEAGGTPYSIRREIERISFGQRTMSETKQWGKTTLDFTSVDDDLNGTSRPETERHVRYLIGTFEDFCLTTMVSQNPIFALPGGGDVVNCKETDRRKILFRFLQLDVYERVLSRVKDELKTLMGRLSGLDPVKLQMELLALIEEKKGREREVPGFERTIARLETDLKEAAAALERTDIKHTIAAIKDKKRYGAELTKAQTLLAEAETELLAKRHGLEGLRASLAHLGERPPEPEITLADLTAELERVRERRETTKRRRSLRLAEMSTGQEALRTLDDIPCEGKFPSCRYIVDATEFEKIESEVQAAIENLTADMAVDENRANGLTQLRVIHELVQRWDRDHNRIQLSIVEATAELTTKDSVRATLTNEVHRLQALLKEAEDILRGSSNEQASAARDLHVSLSSELKSVKQTHADALKSIGGLEVHLMKLQGDVDSLEGLRETVRVHEAVVQLCGKNGLPYRILAMVLPVINAEIAKILTGVVGFNVFFEDDPEEQTVRLYLRYGDYKSRPLSLCGGAERFIAALAIRVALLSVSSIPKTDILIIDEGFGKLDPENLEALHRMFEYLRQAFGTIFVVSHVDFMKDIVDHSIEITSQDGYAHVEVT
jgi:DNA repair exonuclease SbcCD ATPase subunit/DNA repair exonuclease SbcCD nuclease subunit